MRRAIVAGLVVCVKRLAGDQVPMERLTLRLAGDNDDAQALARAGWAACRLRTTMHPADDLAEFLGRQSEGEQERLAH
jgi:hypothetical protein